MPSGPDADLGPEPRGAPPARVARRGGPRAVSAALRRARRTGGISKGRRAAYARVYSLARSRHRRLGGTRRRELGSVIDTIDAIALRGELSASRMPAALPDPPAQRRVLAPQPFSGHRGVVTFRGSELVFEYYSGSGLQLQPLVNFKRANQMHGACVKGTGTCEKGRLRLLIGARAHVGARAEASAPGSTTSGSAAAAPVDQRHGAGHRHTGAGPRRRSSSATAALRRYAREAFPALLDPPPAGVTTRGPLGGPHYLQYSFAPRLYIINAFLQAVMGSTTTRSSQATPKRAAFSRQAEPEARRELPRNDTGDWSRYSFGGAESTREYHELLRECSASICGRLQRDVYCDTATQVRGLHHRARRAAAASARRPPPEAPGPGALLGLEALGRGAPIRRAGKVVYDRVATFPRGRGSFAFAPRSNGHATTLRLAAKELRTGRGLRTYEHRARSRRESALEQRP